MNADLAQYYAYHTTIESQIYRSGLWPHREGTSPFYSFIYFYAIVTLSVIGIKATVHGIANMDNVRVLVRSLRGMIAMFSPLMRMVCFLVYRREFQFLDSELGTRFNDKVKNVETRPVLLKNVSTYSKFMHFYSVSTAMTALLYYIPYAILILKHKKNVQVWMGKYPFPVEPRGLVYWMIFAFESSVIWFLIYAMIAVDNKFGIHCFRLTSFLRLASERLSNLDSDDPNCRSLLQECVTIHEMVIRAKEALQKAYGIIIVWTFLISAIVMCSLLWEVDQMKNRISIMKLSFIIFYISMKLIQIFIYAYYGTSVTVEGENYQTTVYASAWPGSGNFWLMKNILIVLMQRSITLKACGFFSINMEFFDKICSTTISYFFLLQSIDASG